MIITNNAFIKDAGDARLCAHIAECENRFDRTLDTVVDIFVSTKPVLSSLAGPSCSGKTTGAELLIRKLREKGIRVKVLSTDDFFYNQDDAPTNPDGTKNYEHFSHIDSDLLVEVLTKISEKKTVMLPHFDFITGKRTIQYMEYDPHDNDIVIVEGIHALNDKLVGHIEPDLLLGIYICVAESYTDEYGSNLFSNEEIRLIRRLVRDKQFRNADAQRTFRLWKSVVEAEKMYIDPFIKNADVKLSSVFAYESSVIKRQAVDVLSEVKPESEFYGKAQSLIKRFDKVTPIDSAFVPSTSLLREFIGY